jgi:hypothetical protein
VRRWCCSRKTPQRQAVARAAANAAISRSSVSTDAFYEMCCAPVHVEPMAQPRPARGRVGSGSHLEDQVEGRLGSAAKAAEAGLGDNIHVPWGASVDRTCRAAPTGSPVSCRQSNVVTRSLKPPRTGWVRSVGDESAKSASCFGVGRSRCRRRHEVPRQRVSAVTHIVWQARRPPAGDEQVSR